MEISLDEIISWHKSDRTGHCRMKIWECQERLNATLLLDEFYPIGLCKDGLLKIGEDDFVISKKTFEKVKKFVDITNSFVESELGEWTEAWEKSKSKDYKRYRKVMEESGKFLKNESELNKYVDRQPRRQRH